MAKDTIIKQEAPDNIVFQLCAAVRLKSGEAFMNNDLVSFDTLVRIMKEHTQFQFIAKDII